MADDSQTRERVRALVRSVLENALPANEAETSSSEVVHGNAIPSTPGVNAQKDEEVTRDESAKTIITETDVRDLAENSRLRIGEHTKLTSLAEDIVRERRIELVRRPARRGQSKSKTIAVGADHGGFEMKEKLKTLLSELGHRTRDFGTNSTDAVDYPDFAHAVARSVADSESELGIIIDGAGVGSCITANKVPGVRAAACYSVDVARNSREHNDANVLTLGSKTVSSAEMREIVSAWLSTEISEDRHRKRVEKIKAIERQYKC
jgi:ribose 5-phosphate isomerase B